MDTEPQDSSPELATVDVSQVGRVAVVTLNRPEQLNAWNGSLSRDLDAALRWCAATDSVGAVVITGAGRAFCAGADLSSGAETFVNNGERPNDDNEARTPKFLPWDVPKPVIAAINGHAVGVGATYALACDLRFAADNAKIGFVFSRRGMLSELGSHAILPKVVGIAHAADLLMSGRAVPAAEAEKMGLVSAALSSAELLPTAMARAHEMATFGAPVSMAISKRLIWESMGIKEMLAREQPLFDWVATQQDSIEGVASFLEKRDPTWKLSAVTDMPHHLFA